MAATRISEGSVARIVEGAGWLELRTDDGAILCTTVYGHGSDEVERRARAYLINEARSHGYARVEPAWDGDSRPWCREPGGRLRARSRARRGQRDSASPQIAST